MAKVIVTGSQGFLGQHMVSRLLGLGYDVCAAYSYKPPSEKPSSRLQYFKLDITKFEDCLKLINQENPDIIIHLVAQPVVTAGKRHPFSTYELTVRGTYNLLEAVRQTGNPQAIIVCTSDKVYGETENAIEGDRIDTVSHPYEVAKTCEDLIAQSYAKIYGLPITIIRSANVYGGGDLHWDRLIPSICKSIFRREDIVLRSTGLQKRDYLYVEDVIDGYMVVLDAYLDGKLSKGSAINFGALQWYSTLEIVKKLMNLSRSDVSLKILGEAQDELKGQHINFDLAKSLGWRPKTSIEQGLEKTLEWYKNWLE